MREADRALAYPSAGGRWLVAAAALGTGAAFLDGSVVNLALPAIGRDLGGGFAVQQWVVDGYLLTLGAVIAALTVGRTARVRPTLLPGLDHPCSGPAVTTTRVRRTDDSRRAPGKTALVVDDAEGAAVTGRPA